eukprot:jgi/Mesvir1/10901/Mv08610-RA.1
MSSFMRIIPYEDLEQDSERFSHRIGRSSGFSGVFLIDADDYKWAVKRIDKKNSSKDASFLQDISALSSSLHHPHLLPLSGVSVHNGVHCVVYPYMRKGSLHARLRSLDREPLPFQHRLRLALGVARGIQALQQHGIVHGNLKSTNVLLDDAGNAKLTDVGVFEELPTDKLERVEKTAGFQDPAVKCVDDLSPAADVFSVGMVLFELLTGKEAYNPKQLNPTLAMWVRKRIRSLGADRREDPAAVADDIGDPAWPLQVFTPMLALALKCTESDVEARPSISQVVERLELLLVESAKDSRAPEAFLLPPDGICVICLQRKRREELWCGHVSMCPPCARDLKKKGHGCPMCRAPVRIGYAGVGDGSVGVEGAAASARNDDDAAPVAAATLNGRHGQEEEEVASKQEARAAPSQVSVGAGAGLGVGGGVAGRGQNAPPDNIRLLVEQLTRGRDIEVLSSARELTRMAEEGEMARRAICDAGAVIVAVRLLKKGTAGDRREASMLVRALARSPVVASAVTAAGAVAPLVAMLGMGVAEGEVALQILSDLADAGGAEVAASIAAAGAIPALVEILRGGTPEGKVHAAGTARALCARSPAIAAALARAGAITPLVDLLPIKHVPLAAHNAAAALAHLAVPRDVRVTLARSGAVPQLVEMLSDASDASARCLAAHALCVLARDVEENQRIVLVAAAVRPLVGIISAFRERGAAGGIDEPAACAAAEAIGCLSACSAASGGGAASVSGTVGSMASSQAVLAGVIPLIVDMLKSPGSEAARRIPALALARVTAAAGPDSRSEAASCGAVAYLVDILRVGRPGSSISGRAAAAYALRVLAADGGDLALRVVRAGALAPALEGIMGLSGTPGGGGNSRRGSSRGKGMRADVDYEGSEGSEDEDASGSEEGEEEAGEEEEEAVVLKRLRTHCVALIYLVCREEPRACDQLVQMHGVAPLVEMAGSGGAEGGTLAAHTLALLAAGRESNRLAVVEASAVHRMATLVKAGGSSAARVAAAEALRRIATSPDQREEVARAGALDALVRMLLERDGRLAGVASVTGALWNVTCENMDNSLTIVRERGREGMRLMEVLVDVLRAGPSSGLFAQDGDKEPVILGLKHAPIPVLLSEVRMNASGLLWNLTCDCPKYMPDVVVAGGVSVLVDLIKGTPPAGFLTAPDGGVRDASGKEGASEREGDEGVPGSALESSTTTMVTKMNAAAGLGNLAADNLEVAASIGEAGAVPPLVHLLKTPFQPGRRSESGPAVRSMLPMELSTVIGLCTEVARAVKNIAADPESRTAFGKAGAAPPLVDLLGFKEGSAELRAMAAAALWGLAYDDDSNKVAIGNAGGIPALVQVLTHGSMEGRTMACVCLGELALLDVNKTALAREGAIRPLVDLLRDGVAEAKAMAALTLGELAMDDLNKMRIAQEGAIPCLVSLLADDEDLLASAEGQANAAGCLGELAVNEENCEAIARAGAIPILLRVMRNGEPEAQAHAAGALRHIAARPAHRSVIHKAGGIEPLVDLLHLSYGEATNAKAAAALSSLVHDERCAESVMAAESAVSSLVRLLREGSPEGKVHAAQTLTSLSQGSAKSAKIIVDEGAVLPLAALVESGTDEAKRQAVAALGNMGVSDSIRSSIAAAGVIPQLVKLLRAKGCVAETGDSGNAGGGGDGADVEGSEGDAKSGAAAEGVDSQHERPGYKKNGVVTLQGKILSQPTQARPVAAFEMRTTASAVVWSLSFNSPAISDSFWECGAVGPLLDLIVEGMHAGPYTEAAANAAGALWNITSNCHEAIADVVEADGVDPLVQLLRSEDTVAKGNAAGALRNICSSGVANRTLVSERGAVPLLVSMIKSGATSLQSKAVSAGALWNLSAIDSRNRNNIVDAGGVPHLVDMLRSSNAEGRANAAGVLRNLAAEGAEVRAAIVAAQAIEPLLEVMMNGTSDGRANAAGAVKNLAVDDSTKVMLGQKNTITCLVELLSLHGNDKARVNAAGALMNLCVGCADNVEQVTRANAVGPLVQLLEDGTPDGRAAAAGTLQFLASDAKNTLLIAWAGAITSLVDQVATGTPQGRAHAARALRNLCVGNGDNRNAIVTAGGIPPLVDLLDVAMPADASAAEVALIDEGCLNAAAAIWALALNSSENRVKLAQGGAIEPLVDLLQRHRTENQEIKAQVAAALWAISHQNEENKIAIANAGAIDEIVDMLATATWSGRTDAAACVWSLSSVEENKEDFVKGGAVRLLVELMKKGSPEGRVMAVVALGELATMPEAKESIAAEGGIPIIVELLRSGNAESRSSACTLIAELALNESNNAAIAKSGAITWLVELLRAGTLDVRTEAAGALRNLAYGSATNCVAIVRAGALQWLLDLAELDSAPTEAHVNAVGALEYLSVPEDTHMKMMRAGCKEKLLDILKGGGDKEVRAHAKQALLNLGWEDDGSGNDNCVIM